MQISIKTYQELENYFIDNHTKVFKIKYQDYVNDIKSTCQKLNQTHQGTHGFRWTFAQNRVREYQKYGYKINPITLVRISLAIHALEIKTYGDMKEQLQGIDTSIFNAILDGKDDSITFELNEFIVELENYFDNLLK